ncbi:MAG: efflux RND transporter periplasmic adaptor subunit [Candidatus Gribaldobacteria bacterium]|nr:efflux RND transporter periplasmic adaptor subunit [Candidatus Gribaldobacteria bacterium]
MLKKRKIILLMIAVVILASGGYIVYRFTKTGSAGVSYITSPITRGALIVSVSGTGQVASSNQVDIKAKTSGDIIGVYAVVGQEVGSGATLAQIDTTEARRALRDAQTSLDTAKLELDKLLEPPDELTLLQAESALTQVQDAKKTAQNDLIETYDDGFTTVANAFLSLPNIMSGMNAILFGNSFNDNQSNLAYYTDSASNYDSNIVQYKEVANMAYQSARAKYDKNFQDYKSTSRFSSTSTIVVLINETYETSKAMAEMIKSANDLIQFYQDKLTERNLKANSLSTTHVTTLNSYTGTVNGYLSSLLAAQRAIDDSIDAIASDERSIKEKTLSLAKIEDGPDSLEVRSKEITIQQKQDALTTAQQNLADCSVKAPFSGVIVKVNIEKGDTVSSGTVLATLVTKQKVAEISLNEVDVAKVKAGQKVTLTFDAVDGLTISGEVAEVDALGTVSQGVVNYSVKIVFDTQDDRVKPGMSVSAAIITEMKTDVLLAPNAAVKSNSEQYVMVLENNVSRNQTVTVGLSNDTMTEIISGLNENDKVITQTITATAKTKTTATRSSTGGIGIPGLGGGGPR